MAQQSYSNNKNMKPLILYKFNESSPARAAMMVGHILRLPFEFIEVSLAAEDHLQEGYLDKNPMHTVPLLNDRGFYIADSHAIATYLITKYGADKRSTLYPNDIQDKATVDSRLYFDTGVLFTRLSEIVRGVIKGEIAQIGQKQIDAIEEVYQITESYLNKSQYIALDHFTVADICTGATITSLNVVVPIDAQKFPRLIQWVGALYIENCFQEVNAPGLEQFNILLNALLERNNSSSGEEGVKALGR